jgi:hypothetical protein
LIKGLEAALKAVVQNAHQRIVAKADRLVAGITQHLGQMRHVGAEAVVGLGNLMGGGVKAAEKGGVAGNSPLGRRDGPFKQHVPWAAKRSRLGVNGRLLP